MLQHGAGRTTSILPYILYFNRFALAQGVQSNSSSMLKHTTLPNSPKKIQVPRTLKQYSPLSRLQCNAI
jgi:hypothetical protein